MRARLLLILVSALLLLAATIEVAWASASRVQVAGLNMSIVPPAGWEATSIPAHPTAADIRRLSETNPSVAKLLESPLAKLFHFRFIASPAPVEGQFTPNLNLVIQAIPKGESLRDWVFSASSAAAQYVGTTQTVTIAASAGIHYWSTKLQKDGTTPLLTDIFVFERNQQAYEFTFTSLASGAPTLRPIFDASGATIASG